MFPLVELKEFVPDDYFLVKRVAIYGRCDTTSGQRPLTARRGYAPAERRTCWRPRAVSDGLDKTAQLGRYPPGRAANPRVAIPARIYKFARISRLTVTLAVPKFLV